VGCCKHGNDRYHWWAVVNVVMKFRFSVNGGRLNYADATVNSPKEGDGNDLKYLPLPVYCCISLRLFCGLCQPTESAY
jgi:hypothetical protein